MKIQDGFPNTNEGSRAGTRRLRAKLLTALAAAFLLPLASPALAQEGFNGQWIIDSMNSSGTVHLTLHRATSNSSFSSSFELATSSLSGLSAEQISSGGAVVRFQLVREAGTLSCEGWFKDGAGSGQFTFASNPRFIAEMGSLGYQGLTDENCFSMAAHDVGTAFVRDLNSLGYEKMTVSHLISMSIHGVTIDFIRGLKGLGYDKVPAEQLVAMRIHGASLDYIKGLVDLGYTAPPATQLISMRIHQVSPDFIRELTQLGYNRVPVEQLISMSIHRVSVDFIKELAQLGYQSVPVESLVSMQIHGVTPDFIRAQKERGLNLTVEQLIRLRIRGQ